MDKPELPPLSEKDKEFAYEFLSDRESYHSHKETSAYTIFAVQAALFTALLTTDWYDKIESKICNPKFLVIIIIFLIWLLVHRFMRWQLINRRLAALQVGTLINALLDYLKMKVDAKANTSSSDKEATEKNDAETHTSDKTVQGITNFLDRWLWPVYSATLKSDVDLKNFPDWYQKHYIAFQKKGTGAVTGEKFPTIGSIFILIISLLYVFLILG